MSLGYVEAATLPVLERDGASSVERLAETLGLRKLIVALALRRLRKAGYVERTDGLYHVSVAGYELLEGTRA